MKPEFTKPFDLEHAKAGAPYCCRNGDAVEIVKWNSKCEQPIVGLFGTPEILQRWSENGQWGESVAGPGDLVMLSLGIIEGKPVFVGDEIEALIVPDCKWISITVKPGNLPRGNSFRWPTPAKAYPTTNMTFDELAIVHNAQLDSKPNEFARSVRAVANAALRHAVDAGQVVPKDEHEAALHRLGDQLKDIILGDRAARDMMIAEAVRSASEQASYTIAGRVDLAAIIATIK
jgi:hypothetical protein